MNLNDTLTPGAVLLEIMQDRNWSNRDVAEHLQVTEQWLKEFLEGRHTITRNQAWALTQLASYIKEHYWLHLNKNVTNTKKTIENTSSKLPSVLETLPAELEEVVLYGKRYKSTIKTVWELVE